MKLIKVCKSTETDPCCTFAEWNRHQKSPHEDTSNSDNEQIMHSNQKHNNMEYETVQGYKMIRKVTLNAMRIKIEISQVEQGV